MLRGHLPLPLSLLSEETGSDLVRYLYVKRHVPGATSEADLEEHEPTVSVANIPQHFGHAEVAELFGAFGTVTAVTFRDELQPGQPKPASRSGQVAFAEEESVATLLALNTTQFALPHTVGTLPTGLDKWFGEYKSSRPDPEQVLDQVNRFMEAFEAREAEERKRAKAGAVTDEDGWTVVVSKKPKRVKLPVKPGAEPSDAEKKRLKKERKRSVVNLYKNSAVDKRREELALLRQKFEEDKKRIEAMRQQRKFNPLSFD